MSEEIMIRLVQLEERMSGHQKDVEELKKDAFERDTELKRDVERRLDAMDDKFDKISDEISNVSKELDKFNVETAKGLSDIKTTMEADKATVAGMWKATITIGGLLSTLVGFALYYMMRSH